MALWTNTVKLVGWARAGFERVAPPLAAVLPWAGGVLLLIASVFAARSWRFVHARVRATATVTENIETFAKGGGIVYSPRLRFRAANGEIVQVVLQRGSDEVEFPAGERLPVVYMAGEPQGAVIATPWQAYHAAIVLAIWGTALFDLGWALRVKRRRGQELLSQPS